MYYYSALHIHQLTHHTQLSGKLDLVVQKVKDTLDAKQKESAAWKAKYNIKTQEEMERERQ